MDPKWDQSLLSQPHTTRNPNTLFSRHNKQRGKERKKKKKERKLVGGG
jgi:hypothetical protein